MTLWRYLLGAAGLALMAGSLALAGYSVRHRLLPGWSGPPARLAETALALGIAVVVAELLGLVGILRLLPVLLSCGAVAVCAWAGCLRRRMEPAAPAAPAPRVSKGSSSSTILAIVAAALVLVEWGARSVAGVDRGIWLDDSLWYHLPFAVGFVQNGSITAIHYTSAEPLTAFYPANSELIQALGILPFHREFLAPLLNLGWASLAMLAGWCIGRPYGRAPEALVSVALVLALPVLVLTQPGTADNDVTALALFLSAVAVLVNGNDPDRPARSWMTPGVVLTAGIAAGLAAGTKLTLLGPALALTVGVIAIAHGRRAKTTLWWSLGAMAGGGFWFARNLIVAGTPLPQLRLGVGALSLPHLTSQTEDIIGAPASRYLLDFHFWRTVFRPYLAYDFGPLWIAILVLAGLGMLWAMGWGRDPLERMLGVLGVVCVGIYLVTPTTGGAFVENLRFLTPALTIGLCLTAVKLPRWRPMRGRRTLAIIGGVLLVTVADFEVRFHSLLGTSAVGLAIGVSVAAVLASLTARRMMVPVLGCALALAVGSGYAAARQYLGSGYVAPPQPRGGRFTSMPLPDVLSLYRWARGLSHARIALAGFYTQYPLYGTTLSNSVDYLGTREPNGGFGPIHSCTSWRTALREDRARYVITAPRGGPVGVPQPEPAEARWTRGTPGVVELFRGPGPLSVFRIDRPITKTECPN